MKLDCKFILFVLIGGLASLVNLGARILINQFTDYGTSIVLAFPIALLTAFILNRIFVFNASSTTWHSQLLRFLIVNLLALAMVYGVSMVFARLIFPAMKMTFHAETLAHAIGLLSPMFISYWAHKHFTFKEDFYVEPSTR